MDRLISVVVACTLAACSLGISAPAANRRRNQMPDCDTSKGLVALDSLAAIGLGVGGLAALGEDEGVGAVALVGAALFTAAALHGSGNADKCRTALAEYGREMSNLEMPVEVRRTPKRRAPAPQPEEPTEVPVATPKVQLPPVQTVDPPTASTPPAPTPPRPEPGARDWSQFWREVP